jgi:16S rRNA (adenine1518-N6/adenine1519-N6)-dimethyltransferase
MSAPAAYAWEDPRRALARHALRPKRAWSQCFLISEAAHAAVVTALDAHAGDPVLDLGAGLGTLTRLLANTGARVTAVERDPDLLRVLDMDFAASGVRTLAADAARLDYAALHRAAGAKLRVAGNIPYAITGTILRSLVAAHEHLACAVLTVQREVRDRLVASPSTPAYGALTVFTTAAFEVHPVRFVSRRSFHPPPRVDSAIVRLTPRPTPLAVENDAFREVVRAAFTTRRKTLRNALVRVGGSARTDASLLHAGIDGRRRGETLSVTEFGALACAWAVGAPGA